MMFYTFEANPINFLIDIILFLTIFFNSAYIYFKAKKIVPRKAFVVLLCCASIVLSVVTEFTAGMNYELTQLGVLLIISFLLLVTSSAFDECSLVLCLIAIGLAHGIKIISTVLVGLFIWLINYKTPALIVYISIKTFEIALTSLLMSIKRFKNGFQFFEKRENLGLGLIITSVIVVFMCFNHGTGNITGVISISLAFGTIVCFFGIYLWIRKSITAHYRDKIKDQSDEYYKAQISEKDSYIEKLLKSNEFMSKVVHRDNHLMNALDTAITHYFETNDTAEKDRLLQEIQTLTAERRETVQQEQNAAKILSSTGNLLIDAAINDLYVKALAHSIELDLNIAEPITYLIGDTITQTNIETLLCDHIKDAIIAIDAKGLSDGKILVTLERNNGIFEISIYDNGVDFTPATLDKLGVERTTTHADNGGSGIGFMTTFETLRKAGGSLIITEFEGKTPYSKAICFRFDKEDAFILNSYRAKDLSETLTRSDVLIQSL